MFITHAMLSTLLLWSVLGLAAALAARLSFPGRETMGLISTILSSLAGAFVGGVFANVLTHRSVFALHPLGFLGSVLGALILLAVFVLARKRAPAW